MASSEWSIRYSLLPVRALILRLRRYFARGIDAQPAGGGEALLRQEAALVVHLLRAFDPVAEIDVRQPLPPRAGDVVEDHEGAERAAFLRGFEERIYHRQPVAEHVGQRHSHQLLVAAGAAGVDAPAAI